MMFPVADKYPNIDVNLDVAVLKIAIKYSSVFRILIFVCSFSLERKFSPPPQI
jgi:hypothetical protein